MACAICHVRREQRFCPALHNRICAACCGAEREVSIDCPSDCGYLRQARRNEPGREITENDRAALFPAIEISEQFIAERLEFITGLASVISEAAGSNSGLRDADIFAALSDLATTYQHLAASGLHYEPANANPVRQSLTAALRREITAFEQAESKHLGYTSLRNSDTLRAIVFLLRLSHSRSSGRPRSRAFLDFLRETVAQNPQAAATAEASGRLVIP